jgi:SAM-dependent methyltransferase
MSGIFDEDYYKSNNYSDYLQREDRYVKLAKEITDALDAFNLNLGPVLDFGCAVGFLINGLQKTGHTVDGVDISTYSVNTCLEKGYNVNLSPDYTKQYGTVYALDVLEHMPIDELNDFLDNIKTEIMVFRVPICAREGENYVLEVSRKDPSHIICWTRDQWKRALESKGYTCIDLNLSTIYTSEGVYAGIAIK